MKLVPMTPDAYQYLEDCGMIEPKWYLMRRIRSNVALFRALGEAQSFCIAIDERFHDKLSRLPQAGQILPEKCA